MIRDIEKLVAHITHEIEERCDIAVVGMSGGADSTLVATLCTLALGPDNVHGIHMPHNATDEMTFNMRSISCAEKLGVHSHMVPIRAISDAIVGAINVGMNDAASQLNAGNARSRARMTVLYGVASHLNEIGDGKRARVIGTGNLSEDYIGYDTKGGDALVDFFPIGELFKSEVYQLLEYFRDKGIIDEEHIDRVPSAGLWAGQTDEGELGHSYDSMEPVIQFIMAGGDIDGGLQGGNSPTPEFEELHNFVLKRHLTNKHKHEAPPVFKLRGFCK